MWEVEAAHIVPHKLNGKDDVLNGLSLCRSHHRAFDAGSFTLQDDYRTQVSSQVISLPPDLGRMDDYDFIRISFNKNSKILFTKKKRNLSPSKSNELASCE